MLPRVKYGGVMGGTWEMPAHYGINISAITPNMRQREVPMILHHCSVKYNKQFTRQRKRDSLQFSRNFVLME